MVQMLQCTESLIERGVKLNADGSSTPRRWMSIVKLVVGVLDAEMERSAIIAHK